MGVLMDGITFGESPRWRDGRLWFSDSAAGRVFSVAADGARVVEAEVASFPMCIDFLPDGRLLILSSADRKVLRREPDGSLLPHADLAPVSEKPWNDIGWTDAATS
jgi:sugar lactone lactonase YvrE